MGVFGKGGGGQSGLVSFMRGCMGAKESSVEEFLDQLISWLVVFHPEVTMVAMGHPSHTVLKVDKQEVLVDFGGLYAWFKRNPDSLAPILDEFLGEVEQELRQRKLPHFEDVVDRIYPQVRNFTFLRENSPRYGKGRLARLELTPTLFVLFVMDEGRGMTFVNEGHLDAWGVAPAGLGNLALRNLVRLGQGLDKKGRLYDQSGYAGSHLLILDSMLGLAPGAELLVGIPDRDTLITYPDDLDSRAAKVVSQELQRQWRNASRPVSPDLHQCRIKGGGGVELGSVDVTLTTGERAFPH